MLVATVSSIYGLGDPREYLKMMLHLSRGERIDQRRIFARVIAISQLHKAKFRIIGPFAQEFRVNSDIGAFGGFDTKRGQRIGRGDLFHSSTVTRCRPSVLSDQFRE